MHTNQRGSRERLLRAISYQEVDHIPCCFMSFTALRKRHQEDFYALARAELEMGLDTMLFIPSIPRSQRPNHPDLRGLPIRFDPAVTMREWREAAPDGTTLLHKEYITPAGNLTTSVRLSEDWPHGDHIPFIDDYQIPRVLKPLVTEPRELDALRYMLIPPQPDDVSHFRREVRTARAFVDAHSVLLAGGWGVGLDMVHWLCGMQNLMFLTMDQPEFVVDLLEMVHQWNVQRMKVVLSAPVDLYIRRAWYEGCDFITPQFYRTTILPRLKREVELAHEHGAKFGYICSSGTQPMLDLYREAGIDVLIGVDPVQGTHTDMKLMKQKLDGRVALWGGVSGAITVEMGSEDEVRAAVRHAISTLGTDGFILSPVDNITVDAPRTWQNIAALIDEWRKSW
ncbi:MAG: uroporphyrinogen decarboxylase family protein [Anaerolineae bacterium]